jgi:hypothetical protein
MGSSARSYCSKSEMSFASAALRARFQGSELAEGHVADADEARSPFSLQGLHGTPRLPVRVTEPGPARRPVQEERIDGVRMQVLE